MRRLLAFLATIAIVQSAHAAVQTLPPVTISQMTPYPVPITGQEEMWIEAPPFAPGDDFSLTLSTLSAYVIAQMPNSGSGAGVTLPITNSELAPGVAEANLNFVPLNAANNLSDLASLTSAQSNLGLGPLATISPAPGVVAAIESGSVLGGATAAAITVSTSPYTIMSAGDYYVTISPCTVTLPSYATLNGSDVSVSDATGSSAPVITISGTVDGDAGGALINAPKESLVFRAVASLSTWRLR
jgi:hypothetical protein